ncbi:MAG: subclass B1 metallo-beta-lactamase [Bacteroidetes bacterium CHB5]|nr:subclass B1 metallo-beta-lactamase [Bacteroidetes bacterium CHB5]
MKNIFLFGVLLMAIGCNTKNKSQINAGPGSAVYQTETLVIKKLSDQVFQHITYLNTESFGRVPCNGMVIVNENEAIVFDTPTDDTGAAALLDYLAAQHTKVKAVVATHFHNDCVGGLKEFHARGIPSYANAFTIQLLSEKAEEVVPQNGFDTELELHVGKHPVITTFLGSGHTRDNVVAYFPEEQTLFGGCLVKEINAGKGYLGDADTVAWAATIQKVKLKYPALQLVIPGHGQPGGMELLDYTAQLFSIKN